MMMKELKMEDILFGDFKAVYNISKKASEQRVQAQIKEDKVLYKQLIAEVESIEELQAAKGKTYLDEKVINSLLEGYIPRKCEGLTEEDKAITKYLLEQIDSIEALQTSIEEEEQISIEELDSFIEEAEKLYMTELLKQDIYIKNQTTIDSLFEDGSLIEKYGNKIIYKHRQIEPILNNISRECGIDVIQLIINAYNCTYSQAVSKLALKLDLNYDHETWFKKQIEILEHNKNLIENPMVIVVKHPQLWNKLKHNAYMRKYFFFLIDLFQTQLEQKGVSYRGYNKPLIASASCGFVAESLGVKSKKTAYMNMNDLATFGLTKKLTDKEVKKIDESRYESILELAKNSIYSTEDKDISTITTYELVLWDDELLDEVEAIIILKQRNKSNHRNQNYQTLNSIGFDNVIYKNTRELSKEDKNNIASLKKWARKKVFEKGGCGFISREDWESRFNKPNNKNTIWAKKDTQSIYEELVMSSLGLSYEYVSNELKSLMNSKKLNKIKHGKVWVSIEVANQLKKYI